MKWTKKAPTEPGTYWLRCYIGDKKIEILSVKEFIIHTVNNYKWLGAFGSHTTPKEYKKMGYEFLGPISPEHTLNFKGE